MTLEISTVVTIVSGISTLLSGWLLYFVTSLRNRLTSQEAKQVAQELAHAKLDGDLRVEVAERKSIDANILRIDNGVRESNTKLDTLLSSLADNYIPRREFESLATRLSSLEQRPTTQYIKNS